MFRFLILGAFVVAGVHAENVARQCLNGNIPLPVSVEVAGCSTVPCALPQSEDLVINVKYNAPQDTETLQARLSLFFGILNLFVRYDLGENSDACRGLANASCPVKEGQELEYTLKLPIEPFFPVAASLFFELSVVDDTNSPAFCTRVPFIVAAPRD